MNESFEQLTALVRGMWHFRWYAMVAAWCIVIAGWPIGYFVSIPIYTAKAQVYVDTQSVLKPVMKGLTIPMEPAEQLGLMARQLMSKPNLERVIAKTKFSESEDPPLAADIALEKLRQHISLKSEYTSSESGHTNFYLISYENRNADLATDVVQSLIDAFTENTLAQVKSDSERALHFVDEQIKSRRQQLMAAESRLRDFQRKHSSTLSTGAVDLLTQKGVVVDPTLRSYMTDYFDRLQSAQAAINEVDLEIAALESREMALKATLSATPASIRGRSADGKPLPTAGETKREALARELRELLQKYTDAHPRVQELRESLSQAEAEIGGNADSFPTARNPVYEKIEGRIDDIAGDLAALRTKRAVYLARAEQLQKQMRTLPAIEDELQRLKSEFANATENYQASVSRRQSMESSQTGKAPGEASSASGDELTFRVVDPPSVPIESVLAAGWSKRLLLATLVLGAGLFGGLGVAVGLDQIRPVVFDQRTLRELTSRPVFGVVPRIMTHKTSTRRLMDRAAFSAGLLLIVVAYAAVLYIQHDLTYRA